MEVLCAPVKAQTFSPENAIVEKYSIPNLSGPRTDATLYRGVRTTSQAFDAAHVAKAWFGDETASISSVGKLAIFRQLRGESLGELDWVRSQFSQYEIEQAIKDADPSQPALEATRLATLAFDLQKNRVSFVDRFLRTHSSASCGSWGDISPFIMFGSVYPATAHIYAGKVLIFSDPHHRGIDCTYWNYQDRGSLNLHGADLGEYPLPAQIQADEVIGMYELNRSGYFIGGVNLNPPTTEINAGVVGIEIEGKKALGLFQLAEQHINCIVPVLKEFYVCEDQSIQDRKFGFVHYDKKNVEKYFPSLPKANLNHPVLYNGIAFYCAISNSNCLVEAQAAAEKAVFDTSSEIHSNSVAELCKTQFSVSGKEGSIFVFGRNGDKTVNLCQTTPP